LDFFEFDFLTRIEIEKSGGVVGSLFLLLKRFCVFPCRVDGERRPSGIFGKSDLSS